MKILSTSNENEMILSWLKSELYRMEGQLSQQEIGLVENANVENQQENQARKNMLFVKYGRSAILDKIPPIPEWHRAEIEEADKDRLYIVPVFDWYLDTGKTFKLLDTLEHLSPDRGYEVNNQPRQKVVHFEKITDMVKNPPKDTEGVVAITSNVANGKFTIIDGTHRASMLINQDKLIGTKIFIGVTPDLSNCIWSAERGDFEQHLFNLERLANNGGLW